jgi:hypothetical protein
MEASVVVRSSWRDASVVAAASPIAVRTSVVCGEGFEGTVVKILTKSEPTDSRIYRIGSGIEKKSTPNRTDGRNFQARDLAN